LTAIASVFTTVSGLVALGTLMVVPAIYQSYKMYASRTEQSQPQAMSITPEVYLFSVVVKNPHFTNYKNGRKLSISEMACLQQPVISSCHARD
jgi:hypothetical protein